MSQSILFITPPFTQLNTPYPATMVLKGFMNSRGIVSAQCDLGLETVLGVLSVEGLEGVLGVVEVGRGDRGVGEDDVALSRVTQFPSRLLANREAYLRTINPVIAFLQGRSPELAHLICSGNWLPEGNRFEQMTDLDHDFGSLGLADRAKYLATLYLEDISDFITELADPHFGFNRYAERLGRSANSFDALETELNLPDRLTMQVMTRLLAEKMREIRPTLVVLTVPFPGNLFCALKCGQWLRKHHPAVNIAMGGGYVNTELRLLSDPRVFKYVDFITLDDGEAPLLHLVEHLDGQRPKEALKRTFMLQEGSVVYFDGSIEPDVKQCDTGTPDYSGLPMDRYLSVMGMANPMHRLWSDGRWNKLMLAHGCYWSKCTFCDGVLDYIKRYEPNKPALICDRMEQVMAQTGGNGFHFTDEAAPPTLLRDLAIEILRRKLTVVWWTNIRFEAAFTRDVCRLLQASGCIAVSGGLEVASDRILKMINKGVTVPQVARVAGNFTAAGIMVHAYLMYGFPTQTAQETVDSLEVVRQLFMNGVVQSGFWHQFAMTAHSPVGLHPEQFGVEKEDTTPGTFANNDLIPIDRTGCDHGSFSAGLEKSLYNFMHGLGFNLPLQEWFDFRTPRTTIAPHFIHNLLSQPSPSRPTSQRPTSHIPTHHSPLTPHQKLLFLPPLPRIHFFTRHKKGKSTPAAKIIIQTVQKEVMVITTEAVGKFLAEVFPLMMPGSREPLTFQRFEEYYNASGQGGFREFMEGPVMRELRENGLVTV